MYSARDLANWIRETVPTDREPLTHLKLQKLLFYCYGAALAFGFEADLGGNISFEPWDHGPVNRDVWSAHKHHKGGPIGRPLPIEVRKYSAHAEGHLKDIIDVYGVLDAWSLRQQTHLEEPWKKAYEQKAKEIPNESLRAHFKQKFAGGRVAYPEYLLRASNFAVDRIPTRGQGSLRELAESVRRSIAR